MLVAPKVVAAIVGVGLILSGCTNAKDPVPPNPTSTDEPTPLPTTRVPATFQVPDAKCPANYRVGLTVTTDSPGEVGDLDKIVACTTGDGKATYLKNESDAVWTLRNTGTVSGTAFRWGDDLKKDSFRSLFEPSRVLLVPGGVITSTLPPSSLAWDINLPLSVSWEGYELVTEKVASLGDAALIAALKRRTPAGAAIAQCTLTLEQYAKSIDNLEDEHLKMSTVVLNGLGSSIATNKCRELATRVVVLEEGTNRSVTLSAELDLLGQQTTVLEGVESRLGYASRGVRLLKLGIRFLHGG